MAKLTVAQPKIIQLEFKQDKTDTDYGDCMWATFCIDTNNYDLMIMSDCGNFSYGWCKTPTESFLHLLSRLDEGYLLEKLSHRTVVDVKETFSAVKELVASFGCEDDATLDWEEIRSACDGFCEDAVIDGLLSAFKGTDVESCDTYDICNCVETDYPISAKKIVNIFEKFVAPKCKELDTNQ